MHKQPADDSAGSVAAAAAAMEPKAEPVEVAAQGPHPAFPSGLRVLVVDDDPLCLKVVGHMLRRCNYEGGPTLIAWLQMSTSIRLAFWQRAVAGRSGS